MVCSMSCEETGQTADKRGRGRPKALSVLSDSHILNREKKSSKDLTWDLRDASSRAVDPSTVY